MLNIYQYFAKKKKKLILYKCNKFEVFANLVMFTHLDRLALRLPGLSLDRTLAVASQNHPDQNSNLTWNSNLNIRALGWPPHQQAAPAAARSRASNAAIMIGQIECDNPISRPRTAKIAESLMKIALF